MSNTINSMTTTEINFDNILKFEFVLTIRTKPGCSLHHPYLLITTHFFIFEMYDYARTTLTLTPLCSPLLDPSLSPAPHPYKKRTQNRGIDKKK